MRTKDKSTGDKTIQYLTACMEDPRLNVWHLALLVAILQLGFKQGQSKMIKVSRSRLMLLSHINTLPTFHKYFKQLQNFGYVKYKPSYHPDYRSEIELHQERLFHKL